MLDDEGIDDDARATGTTEGSSPMGESPSRPSRSGSAMAPCSAAPGCSGMAVMPSLENGSTSMLSGVWKAPEEGDDPPSEMSRGGRVDDVDEDPGLDRDEGVFE